MTIQKHMAGGAGLSFFFVMCFTELRIFNYHMDGLRIKLHAISIELCRNRMVK